MYIHKKYIRLLVMASSVVAYSCYLSSQDAQIQEDSDTIEFFSESKMFNFLVQEYAHMLAQGADSEKVHLLIQEKFEGKPVYADKIWGKVQAIAAQTPSEGSHAFGEKKAN